MQFTIRILALLALIGLSIPTSDSVAAVGDHQWSQGWGAMGVVCPDGNGHIAATGTFFGTLDLGGGAYSSVNFLGGDVFLARFDNAGNHVWSQQITPGGFGFLVDAMTAAPDGSIYLAGRLQNGDIDFGGGVLSGNQLAVLAAFEPDGTHRWSFLVGAGTVRRIAASNTVVAYTGYTSSNLDFGGGSMSSVGSNDAFLAALEPDGSHRFSQLFGGAGGQGGMGLALDASDGMVMVASAETDVDFGGGPLTLAAMDLCVAAFNSSGVHQWSWNRAGDFSPGAGILAQLDVDISNTGEIALGGQFQGSTDLGGGTLTAIGSDDVFVAHYDAAGAHLSSTNYGGSSSDGLQGLSWDGNGNLAVAGYFLSPAIDFGGGPLVHSGGFGQDWFAVVFDDTGAHGFSQAYTGLGQAFMAASHTSSDALLLHGQGSGNTDFGGGIVAQTGIFMASFEGAGSTATATPPSRAGVSLAQNAPNPFNPRTLIRFRVEEDSPAQLEVYDAAGRRVRTLLHGSVSAGHHEVAFDGRDDHGNFLASGIYRYRLISRSTSLVKSMVLVK